MPLVNARYGVLETISDDDLVSRSVSLYGEWAQHELELVQRFVSPEDCIVDGGSYIGTHALPFSRWVGADGEVLCVEPNPVAIRCLETCRARNGLANLRVWRGALGSYPSCIGHVEAPRDPHNLGSSQVSHETDWDGASSSPVETTTLDSFDLARCDLIKLDVEGDEIQALRGATRTAIRHRPVIFCECSFLAATLPILRWAHGLAYSVHGAVFDAFNGDNYFGSATDIFDGNREACLILTPRERFAQLAEDLAALPITPIRGPDDVALLLLKKPQYPSEASRLAPKPEDPAHLPLRDPGGVASAYPGHGSKRSASAEPTTRRLPHPVPACIIVPFYRQPGLVQPLFRSLLAIRRELKLAKTRVLFINDSPEDAALARELRACSEARGELALDVWTNEQNLGFIGSVNRALEACVARREDAILLNSDTIVFPGAIKELRAVAYTDPLIGFVSPRSNNATICTLPASSGNALLTPEEGYRRFREAAAALPRVSYAPTAVGFCLHIKWPLLSEFGLLDPIYGRGYNEENDLIMRANRSGYRAALANWAFVWHEGETSFSKSRETRDVLEERNARILGERYPEYTGLVAEYLSSPEFRAEELLDGLRTDDDGKRGIAFDFTSFGTYHNGTFEAGKRLLTAASRAWPANLGIQVLMGVEAWQFHELDRLPGVTRVDPAAEQHRFAAIIRFGQPFEARQIQVLMRRAPVVAIFMLDPIAADCGNLRLEFDPDLWRFVFQWSDLVFTNSRFTAEQFARRYPIGPATEIVPSLHSLALADYTAPGDADGFSLPAPDGFLLVIGNKFAHKGLIPAVERLAAELPKQRIVALGSPELNLDNVACIPVGELSDYAIARCYEKASCVVFPTHYEGFGFPLLHALARSKPVIVRELPAFREIGEQLLQGSENIHWFQTTSELADLLKQGIPSWVGAPAMGEDDGWRRSALEVYRHLERRMATVTADFVSERLRNLEAAFQSPSPPLAPSETTPLGAAARRGGEYCEHLLNRILANPTLYKAARRVWRMTRPSRRGRRPA